MSSGDVTTVVDWLLKGKRAVLLAVSAATRNIELFHGAYVGAASIIRRCTKPRSKIALAIHSACCFQQALVPSNANVCGSSLAESVPVSRYLGRALP